MSTLNRVPACRTIIAVATLLAAEGLLSVGAEPEDSEEKPRLVKVLFERRVDPEMLKGHELTGGILYLDRQPTEEEVRANTEKYEKDPKFVRSELYFDPKQRAYFLKSTVLGKDLVKEAQALKWQAYMLKNLAVGRNFGEFKHEDSRAGLQTDSLICYKENASAGVLFERFVDKDGKHSFLATIFKVEKPTDLIHHLLRPAITQECRLDKNDAGYVVTFKPKPGYGRQYGAAWLSGEDVLVYLYGTSGDVEKLVPLYAGRFPSVLSKDFKVDRTAWARREMELALEGMKQALRLPEDRAKLMFGSCLSVKGYVSMPMLDGVEKPDVAIDLLKRQYEHLDKWWAENKDNTYWDEKRWKLTVKGPTPEE